jgi:ABC-type dipeptide/oligopeptide/nickel transport system permease subunit
MPAMDPTLAAPLAALPPREARLMLRRLLGHRLALAGLIIIGLLSACALLAPWLASEHPQPPFGVWSVAPIHGLEPPSWEHPLGRDQLGRDQLSRMLYGARTSLLIGLFSVALAILIGTFLGAIAGFRGGWVDGLIMRLMDIMLAFPSLLLALAVVVIIGKGLLNAMLAVGIISIPNYARIVRASVLAEVHKDYVEASRALGASRARLLWRHVLPNALSPLIVAGSLGIGTAILDTAGLGFLGLGAQPPLAEWGLMLSDNRQKLFGEWWLVVAPGLAIMLTVLGFNLLGDGLRDLLGVQRT